MIPINNAEELKHYLNKIPLYYKEYSETDQIVLNMLSDLSCESLEDVQIVLQRIAKHNSTNPV